MKTPTLEQKVAEFLMARGCARLLIRMIQKETK